MTWSKGYTNGAHKVQMSKSHFRRFTANEWNSTAGRPPDSIAMHTFGNGIVLAHCAAPSTEWEGRHGRSGTFSANRVSDLPVPDRNRMLNREIEVNPGTTNARRRLIRMAAAVPPGAAVIRENMVAHLFLGEASSEVA